MSGRLTSRPIPDRRRVSASSMPGVRKTMRDVVVRARLHAVQAERAVDVADLGGQIEAQLAPPLDDLERRLGRPASGDAVRRPARLAGRRFSNLQLERRQGRGHEVELSDRAQVLAERRAFEDRDRSPAPRRSTPAPDTPCRAAAPTDRRARRRTAPRRRARSRSTCREDASATAATARGAGGPSRGRARTGTRRRRSCRRRGGRRRATPGSAPRSGPSRDCRARCQDRRGRAGRRPRRRRAGRAEEMSGRGATGAAGRRAATGARPCRLANP